MLVQNEERYVWYAVMSVVNHVDKILVWDTGSTDKTVEIVKKAKKRFPEKIEFRQVVQKDIVHYTELRQQMFEATKADWMILVDGDEVWWDESLKKVVQIVKSNTGRKLESIVSRYRNVVGDIYHYQEETAGRYKINSVVGHLTIRAMSKSIKGLRFAKPHGQQGIFDSTGRLIQERDKKKRLFIEEIAYMHFTNMVRSENKSGDAKVPKRKMKLKYEIGKKFPLDYYYPEVFFRSRPLIVPSSWVKMSTAFFIKSALVTYPRQIKRRLVKGRSGY